MVTLIIAGIVAWICGTYTLLVVMQDHETTIADTFIAMFWPISLPLLGAYMAVYIFIGATVGRLFR